MERTVSGEEVMATDLELLIGQSIDYPSVYMGGASHQSLRTAKRIIEALAASGFQIAPVEATPTISEDIRGLLEKAHRALSPFVFEAKAFDPPEDDDNHLIYGEHHMTLGHLRNARDAYDAILSALGGRAMLAAAKEASE
jgi:hypothetical protein